MGKHRNKEFKYHYVMRYLNGESPTKLGREINVLLKSPSALILDWSRRYEKCGIIGLESKTGTGKGNGKGRQRKRKRQIMKTWLKRN